MPWLWAVLAIFGVVFLSAFLLTVAVLFTPLVLAIDSGNGQLLVRWLWALEYRRPLLGARGEAEMRFAGKLVKFPARRAKRKRRAAKPRPKAARRRARAVRFLRRCLRQPEIRRILVRRIGQLAKRTLRSVGWGRGHLDLSLPDPAWNGMLAGCLAWSDGHWGGIGSAVHVNFTGENGLLLELRVYPYRVVTALLVFSTGLPYRALLREWRAASALVS